MERLLPRCRLFVVMGLLLAAVLLVACAPAVDTAPDGPDASDSGENEQGAETAPPEEATDIPDDVPEVSIREGVDGWAILVSKEDYSDVGMTDLTTGFLNLYQLRGLLNYMGWSDDHILELRDDFGPVEVAEALAWVSERADEDDVVLLFYQAHGMYTREYMLWSEFFPEVWDAVPSSRRVLIMETCHAGEFVAATEDDERAHLSVGAVAADELGWIGVWEEDLPVVGGAFSYFFLQAFIDPTADLDNNGTVSVQEAAEFADVNQRVYMNMVVWPAFPEYAPGISDYPHVVMDDATEEPIYLDLDAYE